MRKRMDYYKSIPGDFVVTDPETRVSYRGYFSGQKTCLATRVEVITDFDLSKVDWQPEVEILDSNRVLVYSEYANE